MTRRRRGFGHPTIVVHTGFKTYFLIAVMVFIFVGILYPPFFNRVTEMLAQLSKAVRGP